MTRKRNVHRLHSAVKSAVRMHKPGQKEHVKGSSLKTNIPGSYIDPIQEEVNILRQLDWSSPDYLQCQGSSHLVHMDDCQAYCGSCAKQSIPLIAGDPVWNARDLLRRLAFECLDKDYNPSRSPSAQKVYNSTGLDAGLILVPGGSTIVVPRLVDILTPRKWPFMWKKEEYTELFVRRGSVLDIYREILRYYHFRLQNSEGKNIKGLRLDEIRGEEDQNGRYYCRVST